MDCINHGTFRRVRVAILIPRPSGGGAEFVAVEWAKGLTRRGIDVHVIVTHPSEEDAGRDDITVIPTGHRGGFFGAVLAVRHLTKRNRYDAVISLLPYWNLLAILLRFTLLGTRPSIIISERNVQSPLVAVHGFSFRVKLWLSRRLYRLSDACIAVCHPVAAELTSAARVPQKRIWVVPNPAMAKPGDFTPLGDRDARQEALHLVVPARLVSQKRPLVAVEVAQVLRERGHLVTLRFYGSGPLEPTVRYAGYAAGVAVEFGGWVDRWYDDAPPSSIVLLTSLAEGFPNVLVEASSRAFPTVASSRCMGAADACLPGITGELAIDDSPKSYADAVERAIQLNIESTSVQSWLRRYTPDSSVTGLIEVLEHCVLQRNHT